MGIKVALGDALNADDVERAMLGDEPPRRHQYNYVYQDGESRLFG